MKRPWTYVVLFAQCLTVPASAASVEIVPLNNGKEHAVIVCGTVRFEDARMFRHAIAAAHHPRIGSIIADVQDSRRGDVLKFARALRRAGVAILLPGECQDA